MLAPESLKKFERELTQVSTTDLTWATYYVYITLRNSRIFV